MNTHKAETAVKVVILLAVGGMAGAASFTHVHDWTMHNSPAGTPDWFGWANAVISELTPIAAGLEARRRHRAGLPVGYPITVLIAAVLLSLAAQVAVAKPGPSGWLLSSVPALAFMALIKLVISSPADTTTEDPATALAADPTPPPARTAAPGPVPAPAPAPAPAHSDSAAGRDVLPVAAGTLARSNGRAWPTGGAQ